MILAFVNADGHSITEYAMSSVDIFSRLGESKVGRELAQLAGVALRDSRTVTRVTVKMGEGITL
jgi:hypothetical protein